MNDRDEEVLVLFAAQAAAAIVPARAFSDERRARADLEALVETSPVGVAVFDAATGRPTSLNREVRRIVESLRSPGRTAEDLLGVLTCRFADGRELSLAELPLAGVLGSAETVRGEEIELTVPDGRSVTVLVNATPIHAEDGTVVSVVVAMQDLAPLRELERQRTAFLGMVSHELRAPLSSVKGSAATLLEASPAMQRPEMRAYFRLIAEQADRMRRLIDDLLDAGRIEASALSVSPEPTEVAELVERARTTFASSGGRHRVVPDLAPALRGFRSRARRHRPASLSCLPQTSIRRLSWGSRLRSNRPAEGRPARERARTNRAAGVRERRRKFTLHALKLANYSHLFHRQMYKLASSLVRMRRRRQSGFATLQRHRPSSTGRVERHVHEERRSRTSRHRCRRGMLEHEGGRRTAGPAEPCRRQGPWRAHLATARGRQ